MLLPFFTEFSAKTAALKKIHRVTIETMMRSAKVHIQFDVIVAPYFGRVIEKILIQCSKNFFC